MSVQNAFNTEAYNNEVQQQESKMKEEERKQLIIRNLQEILGEDKLTRLIKSNKTIHIYWGTATTGRPHVGYLVPMQKIADFLRAGLRVTILFADLHAFLDNMKSNFELLANRVDYYEHVIKALMIALDVSIEKLHFVRGRSYQLKEDYTKDLLRLSSIVSLRDAIRAGAEVVKQVENPLLSGMLYPLLQALDEQYLKVDGQFGGVDQRKIFILAEEQLPKIKLGKRFHLMNPMVPGLTGSKMSSSEETTKIDLLDCPEIVKTKINSAICSKDVSEKGNGILEFCKHVVFPIMESKEFVLNDEKFTDFHSLQMAFNQDKISEETLKDFLKKFLNEILYKVQTNCFASPSFAEIIKVAYPLNSVLSSQTNCVIDETLNAQEILAVTSAFDNLKLIPSKRFSKYCLEVRQNGETKTVKVLWRCSPKGQITLAHFYALIQLKHLKLLGCECYILVSDLDAFLDKIKCPWIDLKKSTENYTMLLKSILNAIGIADMPIKLTSEYEYNDDFTMDIYKMASVVTRDQTALIEDGNTIGCHLCPIYFALDVYDANVDLVLIGPDLEDFSKLALNIYDTLQFPKEKIPAFLFLPEIIGTNGERMSATKPEFNLVFQDGAKKVRQKIAKSFCEPGNVKGNVALELCRSVVFPLNRLKYYALANEIGELPGLTIERTPENGGDLIVKNYEELEKLFISLKLHPADLKAFLCSQINDIFEIVRNGKTLF